METQFQNSKGSSSNTKSTKNSVPSLKRKPQQYSFKWKLKSTNTKSNGNSLEPDRISRYLSRCPCWERAPPFTNPRWKLCICIYIYIIGRVFGHGLRFASGKPKLFDPKTQSKAPVGEVEEHWALGERGQQRQRAITLGRHHQVLQT